MSKEYKAIRIIFALRICMWIGALAATVYWIYWSFKLYENWPNITAYEYAHQLRPHFGKGLFISIACVLISFGLRSISDRIKGIKRKKLMEEDY